MARRFKIVDHAGKVLGRFTAPDDATPEEIEAAHSRFRADLIAKQQAADEAQRTTPQNQLKCGFCGELVPKDEFNEHIDGESEKNGVKLRLAD